MSDFDELSQRTQVVIVKKEISKLISVLEEKRNDLMTVRDLREFLKENLTIHDPESEDFMRLVDKFAAEISDSIRSYNEILAEANEHLAELESAED